MPEQALRVQEIEVPGFHDYRRMEVVRLSAVPHFSYFKNINESFNKTRISTGVLA
jgi:hypothetical protein